MNPDKLFNYLDGKLSSTEREELEDQLIRDPELQREFAMARNIHQRMSGEFREVILDEPTSGLDPISQRARSEIGLRGHRRDGGNRDHNEKRSSGDEQRG